MTILAIGLDSDKTMVHFLRFCRAAGIKAEAINLRELAICGSWHLGIPSSGRDFIKLGAKTWRMEEFRALYARPIDLTWRQQDQALTNRWSAMMAALTAWLTCAGQFVVNRPLAGAHNSSKPLHEQLIRQAGLQVPPSLSSYDTEALLGFASSRPSVIKAMGGARGDTSHVTEGMLQRNHALDAPVHIQEFIQGTDVRVHVIRDQVCSTLIESDGIDYRAAGTNPRFSRWQLPAEIQELVVSATRSFGLEFAGWDFKIDRHGTYWCLEANPQPGYSMYDRYVDFDISKALTSLLGQFS